MGNGYAILIWAEWGCGLVRVDPRLHVEGEDIYGNPCNWFPCEGDTPPIAEIRRIHNLPEDDYPYIQVIP